MTKREELRKQYAEYERKLDAVRETEPENEALEMGCAINKWKTRAIYHVEEDMIGITQRYKDGNTVLVFLTGDEAGKLYHFLGGLYG
jgi:hypothetical protein